VVDEDQFRRTARDVNRVPCVFERAILSASCQCKLSQRLLIAEREAGACRSEPARAECAELLEAMRSSARFTLKLTHVDGPLPFGQEIKVQAGGLIGLQHLLHPHTDTRRVDDVRALVEEARVRYGELARLPFQEIVKSIGAYQHRRRRG